MSTNPDHLVSFAAAQATRVAEAIFALFGPLPEDPAAPGAVVVRSPELFVRTLEAAVKSGDTPALRGVARTALDAWNEGCRQKATIINDSPQNMMRTIAARLGIDPRWLDEEWPAENVIRLADRRPLTGMVPEATRAWHPLDADQGGEIV